jgi:hypothetical protein
MAFDFLYNSSNDGKLLKKECDFIHEVADKVIDSRRKTLVIRLIAPNRYNLFPYYHKEYKC